VQQRAHLVACSALIVVSAVLIVGPSWPALAENELTVDISDIGIHQCFQPDNPTD
jgi:hypothetical protein